MTGIILTTIFGSLLTRILNLRGVLEFKPEEIHKELNLRMLFVAIIDVVLGLALMSLQFKGTGSMNLMTALEVGVGAPFIFMKIIEKTTGRSKLTSSSPNQESID